MKTILLFSLPFLISIIGYSQKNKSESHRITYQQYSNDKYLEDNDFEIIANEGMVYLSKSSDKIQQFIDYKIGANISIMQYEGELYKTIIKHNDIAPGIIGKGITENILGYDCLYMVYTSFSNKIEVWFTRDAGIQASPYARYVPFDDALVLKLVINGNRSVIATKIEVINNYKTPEYPYDKAITISESEMEEKKILSRYKIVNVFDNERINFDTDLPKFSLADTTNGQTFRLSNGGVILKKITIPDNYQSASYCFAKLNVRSDGDAYDRTGSVFIISEYDEKNTMMQALFEGPEVLPKIADKAGNLYQGYTATENFVPPVELMRFFTSFGVGHFNELRPIKNYNWENDVVYKQDISQLIPSNQKEVWIGVFIGNYDKGGHIVSLELNFYPGFENEKENQKFILPLFNTVNILEMSGQNYARLFRTDTLTVDFEIPDNLIDPALLFTSTGHGGWGNGDEFVAKLNEIYIDGERIFNFIPWRTDCATYRLLNPASGNFSNGLSSSDLSRSNWCPATLTPPQIIPLNKLKAGKHQIQVVIDQGEDEGNSFSHWSITGVIVGELK